MLFPLLSKIATQAYFTVGYPVYFSYSSNEEVTPELLFYGIVLQINGVKYNQMDEVFEAYDHETLTALLADSHLCDKFRENEYSLVYRGRKLFYILFCHKGQANNLRYEIAVGEEVQSGVVSICNYVVTDIFKQERYITKIKFQFVQPIFRNVAFLRFSIYDTSDRMVIPQRTVLDFGDKGFIETNGTAVEEGITVDARRFSGRPTLRLSGVPVQLDIPAVVSYVALFYSLVTFLLAVFVLIFFFKNVPRHCYDGLSRLSKKAIRYVYSTALEKSIFRSVFVQTHYRAWKYLDVFSIDRVFANRRYENDAESSNLTDSDEERPCGDANDLFARDQFGAQPIVQCPAELHLKHLLDDEVESITENSLSESQAADKV